MLNARVKIDLLKQYLGYTCGCGRWFFWHWRYRIHTQRERGLMELQIVRESRRPKQLTYFVSFEIAIPEEK